MYRMNYASFKKKIWAHHASSRRSMIWREHITDYTIVISEIMLQQTQVERVHKKFPSFIQRFPSFEALSKAPLSDVLREWQGLGYNRRALNLHKLSHIVVTQYGGHLPSTYEDLIELPGIGPNTAGSILAFAFNIAHPFIETNIRTVYIHHFFPNASEKVSDKDIIPLITATLDTHNAREWYYALMDYGSFLKKTEVNPSRKSAHHVRQTPFKGSNREMRSHILKALISNTHTLESLHKLLPHLKVSHIEKNIEALIHEGFISKEKSGYLHTRS